MYSSGLARPAAGGHHEAVGARSPHQRRQETHAVLVRAHTHGHTLPAMLVLLYKLRMLYSTDS